ncbi:E3 ubiquitin-protein ligase TRIM39-like [Huso huso]|uniref:E3 ubiquitin-protein ligase TRIM39-like n=1 Tax=Huso huso TaxID=61971 RepID=A0ABR0Z3N2_HUSHU
MSLSKPEKLLPEELTCPICMQVFSDTVVLPCGHSFCASCIGEVIEREAEKGQHTCPECRSEHKGKAALQRNFKLCNIVEGFKASECTSAYQVLCDMCLENALPAVKTCLKCEISLCALHLKRHGEKKTFQSHSLVDPTAELSARKCSLHDKPLEHYCVEDRSCICILCAFEGNHKNHNAKHLQTAHDEFRTTMEFQLKEITAKLNLSERLLQKGKEDESAVKAENAEMKQKSRGAFHIRKLESVQSTQRGSSAMATSKPEKLFQEELICPICLQVFSEPVVLPCGHNFCASCIREVIEREAEKGQHTCPECRSEHKGKAALQRNFKLCNIVEGFKASECTSAYQVLCDMCLENALPAVKTCLKCEISLCALHLKRHGEKKTFQSHSLVDPKADLSARKCSLHDKPLEYYCVEDRSCICVSCCIEGNHKNHDVKSFKTAHAEMRVVLESQLKEITAKLNLSESLLQKGKENESAVKAENAEMKQKAVELLDRLAELVANYKAHVIETIEAEQRPVVESLQQSIRRVTEQQNLLKHTQLQADSVWAERDEFFFIQKLLAIDSKLTEAIKEPLMEPTAKCLNKIKICDSLEKTMTEIQAEMARIQRDLQALINPSQPLTFDPNTVHPNLILSDDLKTVRYTDVKQPYPYHAERFKDRPKDPQVFLRTLKHSGNYNYRFL